MICIFILTTPYHGLHQNDQHAYFLSLATDQPWHPFLNVALTIDKWSKRLSHTRVTQKLCQIVCVCVCVCACVCTSVRLCVCMRACVCICILDKWKTEYEALFTFNTEPGTFDDAFYEECLKDLEDLEQNGPVHFNLDQPIDTQEVKKVIEKAKFNKSIGIDNLPNEIFKNGKSTEVITKLFNKVYDTSIVPTIWRLAIIKPIPKNSTMDPRLPLQYRGISLLSTVYKLYASVLNNRIVNVAEGNQCFVDEQNGFRKNRSCSDHLFTLTSIIRNRKHRKLSTYVAFVDLEKAFDRIDRTLLYYKLRNMGFGGKIYQAVKTIYQKCSARININDYLTNNFSSEFGVRQGDSLSPTLFGLFINDLATDLNNSGNGINIENDLSVKVLMFADDLAILSESEQDLQNMIQSLYTWCKKWRMKVNVNKTKIVHFRNKGQQHTHFNFSYGSEDIEVVESYKYLGLIFDDHLDYNTTANALSGSAGRALGGIYSKFKKLNGLGYQTYTKLYHTGVVPIMDYCSGIWGYQNFGKLNTIQNRSQRLYLGVHRFASNLAINGDMGWVNSNTRRKLEMLRLWKRLIKMDNSRLSKKIILWDKVKLLEIGVMRFLNC